MIWLTAVLDRGPNITIAGPLPSVLDRRSNVLAGHVIPLFNSRSSAAIAVPKRCFLDDSNGQPDRNDHDVDSHHKARPAVMWRRRSPRSIWRRRWPGPRWTPLQTRRLFSEQPPASSSQNPQTQVQTSWDCPFSHTRGWVLYFQQTGDVTNSRTLFKHATQFVQHEWMEYIIPMQQVTTQLWETSAKGTSQYLCLWRMFCHRTLCGDLKWRAAIASQLVTRADQQPHRVRAVQMGPSVYKRFLWKISACNSV